MSEYNIDAHLMSEYKIDTHVISLEHRQDRRNIFEETNKGKLSSYNFFGATDGYEISYNQLKGWGYNTCHEWIDPFMTCIISPSL